MRKHFLPAKSAQKSDKILTDVSLNVIISKRNKMRGVFMKKIIAIIMSIILVFSLAACSDSKSADVKFENEQEAYEAMTGAVEEGDYEAAINYYNSSAADSSESDVVSLYYYSLAMYAYEEKGCLGYSADLLSDRCSSLFEPAQEAYGKIQLLTRALDGSYQSGDFCYLYFVDGKIAIGEGGQLTGTVFCNSEIVKKDNKYYWAEHNTEGEDTLIYEITLTDTGITLTAVDESNDMYSGTYTPFAGEMPMLVY